MRERIVLVTTSYPRDAQDPSGHFVHAEAEALVQRGAEVTVLCPGDPATGSTVAPRVVRLWDSGLFGWPGALPRLRQRPDRVVGLGRFVVAARHWLRQAGPLDGIVAHWVVPCGWPVGLAGHGPLEVVAHGSDVRVLLQAPLLARLAVRQLLARGTRFRFVSHELRRRLGRVAGPALLAASRVEPSPLGLPRVPSRDDARQRFCVPDDARLVIVVSRLVRGKRLGTALSAASLIPGAVVVVVGDGPLGPALAARFARARFVGQLPRELTLAWMAAADVLITASRNEGAPTVVREARALGLPVVATPVGDLSAWATSDAELALISASAGGRNGDLD